jgi:transposase
MPYPRRLEDDQEVAVAKAYREGASTSELSAEYGVHADTIRNAVTRQGVELRPRGGVPGKPRNR